MATTKWGRKETIIWPPPAILYADLHQGESRGRNGNEPPGQLPDAYVGCSRNSTASGDKRRRD